MGSTGVSSRVPGHSSISKSTTRPPGGHVQRMVWMKRTYSSEVKPQRNDVNCRWDACSFPIFPSHLSCALTAVSFSGGSFNKRLGCLGSSSQIRQLLGSKKEGSSPQLNTSSYKTEWTQRASEDGFYKIKYIFLACGKTEESQSGK